MRLRRRLSSLLLVLVAVFGLSVSATPATAADDGLVDGGIEASCRFAGGPVLGFLDAGVEMATGSSVCAKLGDKGAETVDEAWTAVEESLLGDITASAEDAAKWVLKTAITVSLLGPSVDLRATGLWGGEHATLAGMMTWLGLVIAVAGVMWQLGKMALTGQVKHAGRAMAGWVENLLLSTVGVAMFALLLMLGDVVSSGLVNATFDNEAKAYDRIFEVLLPNGIGNPITMLGVVQLLLLVGFIQLVMIFLRQSAIPIICVLLPVAGGGRTGGDVTRRWAPALITSGLVIIAYKPTVAIIMCIGFAELGESVTLAEWLRGCATLILAILAPGPLTKIFAPFGAAAGGGMSAGGAVGALAGAASYFGSKTGGDGGGGDGAASGGGGKSGGGGDDGPDDPDPDGGGPPTAVAHAQLVEQSMGKQGGGEDGGEGEAGPRVPGQGGPDGAPGGVAVGEGVTGGTGAATGAGGAAAVAGPVAGGLQVLDGVNDAVQGASGAVGGGDQS